MSDEPNDVPDRAVAAPSPDTAPAPVATGSPLAAPSPDTVAFPAPAPAPAPDDAVLPLPPARAGLRQVVVPATALWFVGFVVLLFLIPQLRAHDAMIWLWTALAGWVLGLTGLTVYGWQRRAARRGHRGASSMALDEQY